MCAFILTYVIYILYLEYRYETQYTTMIKQARCALAESLSANLEASGIFLLSIFQLEARGV